MGDAVTGVPPVVRDPDGHLDRVPGPRHALDAAEDEAHRALEELEALDEVVVDVRPRDRGSGLEPVRRGFGDLRPALLAVGAHVQAAGSRVTELAEQSSLTKATVVYLVDELERLGYLTRRPDPADGRAKLVVPTPRAAAAEAAAREAIAEIRDGWAGLLGEDSMALLDRRDAGAEACRRGCGGGASRRSRSSCDGGGVAGCDGRRRIRPRYGRDRSAQRSAERRVSVEVWDGRRPVLADASAWMRARRDQEARERLLTAVARGDVAWCWPVRYELMVDARGAEGIAAVDRTFESLREVAVDRAVQRAVLAAMRELASSGSHGAHRLPLTDFTVAVAAQASGVDVLHFDRHFERLGMLLDVGTPWLTEPDA